MLAVLYWCVARAGHEQRENYNCSGAYSLLLLLEVVETVLVLCSTLKSTQSKILIGLSGHSFQKSFLQSWEQHQTRAHFTEGKTETRMH